MHCVFTQGQGSCCRNNHVRLSETATRVLGDPSTVPELTRRGIEGMTPPTGPRSFALPGWRCSRSLAASRSEDQVGE